MALSITQGVATSNTDLRNALSSLQVAVSDICLNTGGLAIKTGGSALAKTANAIYYYCNGALYTKAAGDMAALSGTVSNAAFNVFCFYVNASGTLTTLMGTEGASLGAVVFPTQVSGTTMIGFVIINPTGTGDFVGGTTALDDGTVAPNAVYVNAIGASLNTAVFSL